MGGAAQRTETAGVRPWVRAALRCGAVLAAAALALPAAAQAAWAAPDPGTGTVVAGSDPLAAAKATLGPLLDQLHTLYQSAEAATEQYNGTVARIAEQQASLADLQGRSERQQKQVDAGTDIASQLAAAQYRNGAASAYAELLLSKDPYEAVTIAELLAAASRSQSEFLDRLKSDRDALDALKKQTEDVLKSTQELVAQQDAAKAKAAADLASVEQMVASLTGAQRTELEQLEKAKADEAQLAFLATGALGKGERTPSLQGRAAVAFALAQLGKPYLWGGTGPGSYDCSGLTSQAWLHAGKPIPRTSQEQWAQLPHVALNQLRPGDLVIYFQDASHVGMYIGGGLIVQAPRPGAFIKVSPVGSMPILGAVRPDPSGTADDAGGAWKVPDLPAGWDTVTPIAPSPAGQVPPPATGGPATPPAPGEPAGTPGTPTTPTAPTTPGGTGTPTDPGTPSGTGTPTPTPTPGTPTGTPGTPTGTGTGTPATPGPTGTGTGTPAGTPSGTRSTGASAGTSTGASAPGSATATLPLGTPTH
ncbi:C40 family peptidase [Streptomyces sp. NRRL S-350]|uniref:C40 family peptidase n=1 Tax=Streptomyces sp. NRRL S-350 TaxID=1463902 RepID=UPI00099D7D56|nr:NlpC/P60 family protein [Streptomyces sp. NRRL S-350]